MENEKSRFVLPFKSVAAGKFLAYVDYIAFIKSFHIENEA